jgi:hypothetical protein
MLMKRAYRSRGGGKNVVAERELAQQDDAAAIAPSGSNLSPKGKPLPICRISLSTADLNYA